MEQTQSASALVVRNIGEIEAALAHAEKIGSILWEAVEAALRGRLEPLGWQVSEFDGDRIWFAPHDWIIKDDDADADPFFTIEEAEGPEGESDETWLAEFLQAGPNGAGVALWFSSSKMDKKRYRQRLTAQDSPDLATLLAAGVTIDNNQWLRLPIKLEPETLAQGAEDDDYSDALKPLHDALDVVLANVDCFAGLIRSGELAESK